MDDENVSGAFDAEEIEDQAWREAYDGWWECPYCGKVTFELSLCCGELHGEKIRSKK